MATNKLLTAKKAPDVNHASHSHTEWSPFAWFLNLKDKILGALRSVQSLSKRDEFDPVDPRADVAA